VEEKSKNGGRSEEQAILEMFLTTQNGAQAFPLRIHGRREPDSNHNKKDNGKGNTENENDGKLEAKKQRPGPVQIPRKKVEIEPKYPEHENQIKDSEQTDGCQPVAHQIRFFHKSCHENCTSVFL